MPRKKDFLLRASVKEKTLDSYEAALADFQRWREREKCKAGDDLLDEQLVDYMHWMYEQNPNRGQRLKCQYVISALEFWHPRLKGKLSSSKRALKGWDKLVPASKRVPIAWEWACAISYELFRRGRHSMAVATLLAFDCMLRREDFCQLKKCEVILEGEPQTAQLAGQLGVVVLDWTKTGPDQSVSIRNPVVYKLLKRLKETAQGEVLFDFSTSTWNKQFLEVCESLGLRDIFDDVGFGQFSGHGLRHGGASHDYERGIDLKTIMYRGRWKGDDSQKIYIQQGRAVQLALHLPIDFYDHANYVAANLETLFNLS